MTLAVGRIGLLRVKEVSGDSWVDLNVLYARSGLLFAHSFQLLARHALVKLGADIEAGFTHFKAVFTRGYRQVVPTRDVMLALVLFVHKSQVFAQN